MAGSLIVLLVVQSLFAKTYGGASTDYADYPGTIIQTTDGGYAVAGYTRSFDEDDGDFFVLTMTPDGILAWARGFGGTTKNDRAYSIVQAADGGYAVVGRTQSFGAGLDDFLVLRLTPGGAISWDRVIGGPGYDYGYSVVQAADGGYVIAGATSSFGAGAYDCLVLGLATDGSLARARTFGGTSDDGAWSMIRTADGGYAVAGYTNSFGAGSSDLLVLKLSSDGGLQWAKTFGGTGPEFAYSIVQATDGGFAVAGFTSSFGAGGWDFLVIKLDPDGSLQWARTFGGANWDYGYSVAQTTDGGYAVAGATLSFGAGQYDCLVIKLAPDGSQQWARTFGETGNDEGHSISRTTDGGCVVAGYTSSFGAGGSDVLVLRLSSDGNYTDCVETCFPTTTTPALSTFSPSVGADCSPSVSSPSITVSTPVPVVADACLPLYVEEEETLPPGDGAVITPSPVPGGVLFTSLEELPMRIYTVDGRLAWSGQLAKGENRVSLGRGIYLWQAGSYLGKAVVR